MIFNSVEFALFFPLIFILYWGLFRKNIGYRNLFLVVASYIFYGVWDWRFLILIFLSSLGDYILGKKIYETESPSSKKFFLISSLVLNLGILGFFKYFNFFVDSFVDVFRLFGTEFTYQRLNIILPVGISFYTFQTLSYTLDIYNKKLEPTEKPLTFFAFVSFFPQLVAGPIERAKDLLPQFLTEKKPNYEELKKGILQVVFGLFKKVVIADRLAIYVDSTYGNIQNAEGLPLLIGVIFFAFQLYLDFSAYSDIAIGLAKTLGFKLSVNFRRPYLSKSFSDFWSRWHISLSSWFRDYLYIPLGGSRNGKTIRNILIVFLLSGLWHGASWNFVIWGALNGLFLIVFDRFFQKKTSPISSLFVVICWILSLVFFRAETFNDSLMVFSNIGLSNSSQLYEFGLNTFEFKLAVVLLLATIVTEILAERNINLLAKVTQSNIFFRYAFYLVVLMSILMYGSYGVGLNDTNFIYFQF